MASEDRVPLLPNSSSSMGGMSREEYGETVLRRWRSTWCYLAYCVLFLFLSLFCLVSLLAHNVQYLREGGGLWLLVVECIMTGIILTEVAVAMYLLGCGFFKSCWHVFDLLVGLLSLGYVVTEIVLRAHPFHFEAREEVFLSALVLRYIAIFFRIVKFMRDAYIANTHISNIDDTEVKFEVDA